MGRCHRDPMAESSCCQLLLFRCCHAPHCVTRHVTFASSCERTERLLYQHAKGPFAWLAIAFHIDSNSNPAVLANVFLTFGYQ